MSVLYEDLVTALDRLLVDVDVFNFTPFAKFTVDLLASFFDGIGLCLVKFQSLEENGSTFVVKRTYTRQVLLERSMPSPAKDVSNLVFVLRAIRMIWYSVVVSAVGSLSAGATGEIDAEPGTSRLLEGVSFCEACLFLRIALVKGWHALLSSFVHVCEVLVIPDIIFIVALHVGNIVLRSIRNLFSCWPLKPSLSVLLHFEPEKLCFCHILGIRVLSLFISDLFSFLFVGHVD